MHQLLQPDRYAEVLVAENWDSIADWYAGLVRDGSAMHEFSRDILLSVLPPTLAGAHVLDVGCGEGIVTRALAARGAVAVGVDPTSSLIAHARAAERAHPTGASYHHDDGLTLSTVGSESMDWAIAALSLNNISDLHSAVGSIKRVLKPGGRLAFTVPHPCFDAPEASTLALDCSLRRVIGDYLAEGFWRSTHPQSVRRAGNYHRTITGYITTLLDHGFSIEVFNEPAPDQKLTARNPHRAALPPFLLVRADVGPNKSRGRNSRPS
jgi:ubiquinone/menaquinone biosynthesis C-methylase UbiE